MYNSQESFFVLTLAGSNLEDLIESSFYLVYHAGIQPSEVDKLSTYEFRKYILLLNDTLKDEKEYEKIMAQNYGIGSLLGTKER